VFAIIQTDKTTSDIKFPSIIAAVRELKPRKAIIFAGLDEGAAIPTQYTQQLRAAGVPYFPSPDRALRALARFIAATERDMRVAADAPPLRLSGRLPASGTVPEYQSKQLLAPLGIPFPIGRFVSTLDQATHAASVIGYPVALKAQSAHLPHKSDAGGVVLGLGAPDLLASGWQRLHSNIARHRPELTLEGVLVECMSTPGLELIVGGRNDPDWGEIVIVGLGGVQAELLRDNRLLPPDLTLEGIVRELGMLKGAALLQGFRGSPALDVTAVAEIILRVCSILRAEPSIRELDLNPVVVYPKGLGAIVLDALIFVGSERQEPATNLLDP
jgi:acetate---CoA ligase (ADP-forming)